MSKQKKRYDYVEALNPESSRAEFIDYRRILRKLVREAVLLANRSTGVLYAPETDERRKQDAIAKELIP